jgi:hypothetical protein
VSDGGSEREVTDFQDDTSHNTGSLSDVDSIRILRVSVDGEDLGCQGDRVAILVVGFGLSAFLFGDRVPLSPSLSRHSPSLTSGLVVAHEVWK